MRKKLYLVALFCGALCLTGCLKNEESASVTQVRFAKANELNSLAALNNAKAQATTIAAEADAAYKAAEAKVQEAQAKLIEAQAAYWDAETQLKLVEVELQGVKVQIELVKLDEEKQELEKKKLELAKLREELEVAKAQAAADKAYWVARLAEIERGAKVQAAKDELALQKAQRAIEKWAEELEAEKADAIKDAADKYFAALKVATDLNADLIDAKVLLAESDYDEKAAIEDQIDAITNRQQTIKNYLEPMLAEMESIATMTPEQVEEAEIAAEAALVAALEEYVAAQEALSGAEGAEDEMDDIWAKHSKFYDATDHNWDDWAWSLYDGCNYVSMATNDLVTVEGYVDKYEQFGFIEPNDDPTADPVFVPLFNYETVLKNVDIKNPDPSIYGDDDVYASYRDWKIVPATINYDNIKHLEDLALAKFKKNVDEQVEDLKETSANNIAQWEKDLDWVNNALDLHKAYVAERSQAVEAAEQAFQSALGEYNDNREDIYAARKAYEDYMVVKYDISRTWFEAVWAAADDTVETSAAYWAAKAAYDGYAENLPILATALSEANTALQTAKQAYLDAKAAWDSDPIQALITAQLVVWNPDFTWKTKTTYPYYQDVANAGSSQEAMLIAYRNMKDADADLATKKAAYDADPNNAVKKDAYIAAVGVAASKTEEYNIANAKMNAEGAYYNSLVDESTPTKKALDDAIKAWNPEFDAADPSTQTKNAKGEWVRGDKVAGTSQAAMLDAYVAWDACNTQVNKYHDKDGNRTARKNLTEAQAAHQPKLDAFNNAWGDLVAELGFDPEDADADAEGKALWEATKIAEVAWSTVTDAWNALNEKYNVEAVDSPYVPWVGWLKSSYAVDPYAEYIYSYGWEEGKYVAYTRPIAFFFGYEEWDPELGAYVVDAHYSQSEIIKKIQKDIDDEPEKLADLIAEAEAQIPVFEENIAEINAKIESYMQYEGEYTEWVAAREAAIDTWNAAKTAMLIAKAAYLEAAAEFEADHGDFFNVLLRGTDGEPILNSDGEYQLNKISAQEMIELLKDAIEDVEEMIAEEQHNLWEMRMEYDAWKEKQDKEIEVLEARVAMYTKVADYYKAILDNLMAVDASAE